MNTWIASASGATIHVRGIRGRPICGNYGGHWKPVQEHFDPSYFDSFRRCHKCCDRLGIPNGYGPLTTFRSREWDQRSYEVWSRRAEPDPPQEA